MIQASFKNQQYTTLCLAILEKDGAMLVNRAAPQWLIVRDDWSSENVRVKASHPLGMQAEAIGEEPVRQIKAEPGMAVVAFTDGLLDGSKARAHLRNQLQAKAQAKAPFSAAALTRVLWEPLPPELAPIPDDATMLLLTYDT